MNAEVIRTPPAGYTAINGRLWVYLSDERTNYESVTPMTISQIVASYNPFKRDDDGNIVISQDALDEHDANNTAKLYFVKDSEHPEGGMTIYHSHYNRTTKKFELPFVDAEIHAHHERNHDGDVASAVTEICDVKIKLMVREAILVNLNPDQKTHAENKLTNFNDCIDEIVDANIEPALERAWINSHGDILHPAVDGFEWDFVKRAHDFAFDAIALINNKTPTQLRGHRYQYFLCLFDELNADRERTGNSRFLPKGVILVKSKSTPANKAEVTETALFNKLKAVISPTEGPAKDTV